MIIHQSDLKSFHRCGEQHRRQLRGDQGPQLSATSYGSVLHHALHVLERKRDVELAVNTFDFYWHPLHIDVICPPVDEWIKTHSYDNLRTKGIELIRRYWDLKQYDDDEELLALEMPFAVELEGTLDPDTGRPHMLLGTIDRLAIRKHRGRKVLCVDDWKSGIKPGFLQFNIQFTAYAYATTVSEFWLGNPEFSTEGFGRPRGEVMSIQHQNLPRQGFWIDVSGTTPKWSNAGERTHRDYLRLLHAVQTYADARRHQIFPLNIDGSVCTFCPFRDDCPEGIDNPITQKEISQ